MTIATIKLAKRTDKGGWSVTTNEHAQSFLCLEKDYQFVVGEKIEFTGEKKTSKSGGEWYLMKNPHRPEEKPQGGNFNNGAGRGIEWSIFITGIVGRAMGSGKFGLTDIKGLTLAALEAWIEVDAKHKNYSVTQDSKRASNTLPDEEIRY